jgi:hypothetical protein
VADLTVAIDSFAASIGPPGSAREMARPATNGARTIRLHSSTEKSLLVVTAGPFVRRLAGWAARSLHTRVQVSRVATDIVTVRLVGQEPTTMPSIGSSGGSRLAALNGLRECVANLDRLTASAADRAGGSTAGHQQMPGSWRERSRSIPGRRRRQSPAST